MTTIYDVAKEAGVSPKTVSRVLNDDAPVNVATRAKVETAIVKLGFVRSHAARSMRSQRSGLIGIITGAISTSPGAGEPAGLPDIHIVQGAQRIFAQENLTTLISDTGGHLDRVPELVRTLLEHRVEGLLYVADHHQQVAFPAAGARNRLVLVNCYDDESTPCVLPDDESGQYHLAKGLIERGHTRIGYLTLAERQRAQPLRLAGYRRALAEAGIAFDPALVIPAALMDPAHEYDLLWDALDRLLTLSEPPTVICCANDKMAMRVYGLLRDRGLRVPEDISVAGYDDYRIIADHLHPGLSTVVLPYETMGARAAQRLLRIIRGQQEPGTTSTELVSGPPVWRGSVLSRTANILDFQSIGRNNT
ncbi:MAG: LacI family DNA-binding transcriptional regulator [Alphaproteobacteria bacterium]|nr:LacI family DNA-binding transcriptional regulator [Alphaproteobacteria bacterium]